MRLRKARKVLGEVGRRLGEIQDAWGAEGRLTSSRSFARQLADPDSPEKPLPHYRWYDWMSQGHVPQGGAETLARAFASLRKRGAEPRALADWAFTGIGDMQRPKPVNPDDALDPRQLTTQGRALAVAEPSAAPSRATEQLLEDGAARALDALEASDFEAAKRLLRGVLGITREARKIGLATIMGLTVLIGDRADAANYPAWTRTRNRDRVPRGKRRRGRFRILANVA